MYVYQYRYKHLTRDIIRKIVKAKKSKDPEVIHQTYGCSCETCAFDIDPDERFDDDPGMDLSSRPNELVEEEEDEVAETVEEIPDVPLDLSVAKKLKVDDAEEMPSMDRNVQPRPMDVDLDQARMEPENNDDCIEYTVWNPAFSGNIHVVKIKKTVQPQYYAFCEIANCAACAIYGPY